MLSVGGPIGYIAEAVKDCPELLIVGLIAIGALILVWYQEQRIKARNERFKEFKAAYDLMLEEARTQVGPEKRLRMLAGAETYLVNEGLPLLPLFYYVNIYAFDPDRVKNLYLTPRSMTMQYPIEVRK